MEPYRLAQVYRTKSQKGGPIVFLRCEEDLAQGLSGSQFCDVEGSVVAVILTRTLNARRRLRERFPQKAPGLCKACRGEMGAHLVRIII